MQGKDDTLARLNRIVKDLENKVQHSTAQANAATAGGKAGAGAKGRATVKVPQRQSEDEEKLKLYKQECDVSL